MATAAPQQFCVRWNSYHANLQTWFPRLLSSEQFADVTLACESRQLRCHKVVLSACSAYLERLLATNPCTHPIVLMRDMRFSEMQALVDFMYKGEVNVTQDELPSLLKSAEALQIRGLCSSDGGAGGVGGAGGAATDPRPDTKDFTVASDALLAHAHRDNPTVNGPPGPPQAGVPSPPAPPNGHKKKDEQINVKEETVEEDGLYYGELDADNMEYNEEEEPGKPGGSLAQTAGHQFIRVKPESELFFQTKLQNLAKANSEYISKLSKMNAVEIRNEFSKYGLSTNLGEEGAQRSAGGGGGGGGAASAENDYYKSWLEQNGELEVSLLRASQVKKPRVDLANQRSEVELIPKARDAAPARETFPKVAEKGQTRRRGRPPIFKDKNVDIGESVLKSDLDQFLEGKEVSSSGLSRKDLERVMMGKFNPNRRYSNEAMWAALMDVKKGGSIYRAAQTHKVPRKSLRNWMKRCHIKSSFPMPQQLKQFVENSKRQKEFKVEYPDGTFDKSGELDIASYAGEIEFGKHFLFNSNVSSDESGKHEDKSAENEAGADGDTAAGVRTSTEIVTRHFIDMEHGIPLNIHARPRIVGRRPNAIVNIETDVFQEKSYKQYSSQHLRDALIAVKRGYSVYAASNKYGVPRKTLRNWMEKYDIKNFAISNVQCHYDSGSERDPSPEDAETGGTPLEEHHQLTDDHTYGRSYEPPAFIIRQSSEAQPPRPPGPAPGPGSKVMTLGPVYPSVNVLHVGDPPLLGSAHAHPDYNINKRIRRSEVVLRQAADCVSRGLTFQTVSQQFNIPISTIRFFMARKGILPRRRRGRTTQAQQSVSPEPPFHMQHFKLPPGAGIKTDEEENPEPTA